MSLYCTLDSPGPLEFNFINLLSGWCKWYEFGDADVKAAIDFITAVNGKSYNVDWTILKGLVEKIVYGGRVDNNQDFEVSRAISIAMCNSDLD